MKQYKYELYIGLYDKDTKLQEYSNQYYYDTIAKILDDYNIQNYTLTRIKGCYKSNREPSILITIIDNRIFLTGLMKSDFKIEFNQEDVLITRQELEVL